MSYISYPAISERQSLYCALTVCYPLCHLFELVEDDAVFVQVGLLNGSLSNALQLLLCHLHPQHRSQHLSITVFEEEKLKGFIISETTFFVECSSFL